MAKHRAQRTESTEKRAQRSDGQSTEKRAGGSKRVAAKKKPKKRKIREGNSRNEGSYLRQERGKWSEDDMKRALELVEGNVMSIRAAGREFSIPESTIRSWLYGRVNRKHGKHPIAMTAEEESDLVEWALERADRGMPLTLDMLKEFVAEICLDRPTPFRDGVPGHTSLPHASTVVHHSSPHVNVAYRSALPTAHRTPMSRAFQPQNNDSISQPETSRRRNLPLLAGVHHVSSEQWCQAIRDEQQRKARNEEEKKRKLEEKLAAQAAKKLAREEALERCKKRKEEREARKRSEEAWEVGCRRFRDLIYGPHRHGRPILNGVSPWIPVNKDAMEARRQARDRLRAKRAARENEGHAGCDIRFVASSQMEEQESCPPLFQDSQVEEELPPSPVLYNAIRNMSPFSGSMVGCSLEDTHICSQDHMDAVHVSIDEMIPPARNESASHAHVNVDTQTWVRFADVNSGVPDATVHNLAKARLIRGFVEDGRPHDIIEKAKGMDDGWARTYRALLANATDVEIESSSEES